MGPRRRERQTLLLTTSVQPICLMASLGDNGTSETVHFHLKFVTVVESLTTAGFCCLRCPMLLPEPGGEDQQFAFLRSLQWVVKIQGSDFENHCLQVKA